MGKLKISHLKLVGFEHNLNSIAMLQAELTEMWPEAVRVLNTPLGQSVCRYAILDQSDDTLEADVALLTQTMGSLKMGQDDKGDTIYQKLRVDRGHVVFICLGYGSFGWQRVRSGGFKAFVESWPDRYLPADGVLALQAKIFGWDPVFETQATLGLRHASDVADIKRAMAEANKKLAAMQLPPRLQA